MKRNTLTILIGAILLIIFVLLLFTFQVRQTEIAMVTTFDRPAGYIDGLTNSGLKWKWPRPIQKVYKFDHRIHNFEGRFEETLTKPVRGGDSYRLLVMMYAGWTISNPTNFFNSFSSGETALAEIALSALLESAKLDVVGKHPFSDFVSTDVKQLKFVEIEKEVLEAVQPTARDKYGIDIRFVGIKKLGLPESVTEKVFARMQAERDSVAQSLKAAGDASANSIKSAADRDRDKILAAAGAKATAIRSEAEAQITASLAVFKENTQLALFLLELKSLEEVLKNRATLWLDGRTSPFNLLLQKPSPAGDVPAPLGGGNPK